MPVQVPDVHGVADVAMGGAHSLVLCHNGGALAWGTNQNGVLGLGIGISLDAKVPVKVPRLDCNQVQCYLF